MLSNKAFLPKSEHWLAFIVSVSSFAASSLICSQHKMLLRRLWNNVTLDHVVASTVVTAAAYVVCNAYYEGAFPLTKHVPDQDVCCSSSSPSSSEEQPPQPPPRLFLTPLQCRTLERTGYLVVDNFLSREEVCSAARAARNVQSRHFRGDGDTGETVQTKPGGDGDGVVFTGIRSSSLAYFDPSYVGGTEGVPDCPTDDYIYEPALLHVRHLMRGLAHSVRTSSFRGFDKPKQRDGCHQQQGANNNDDDTDTNCQQQQQQQLQHRSMGVPETLQLSLYCANHVVANYNAAHRDGSSDDIWRTGVLGYLRSKYLRQRYLTCILYLNDDTNVPWKSSDGGQLRIYQDVDGVVVSIVEDIEPRGGRLVLLSSKSVLHSVQPSYRDRIACSIWFTRT